MSAVEGDTLGSDSSSECVSLQLSEQVYAKEAVLAAAYKFTGDCVVEVDGPDRGYLLVRLRPKNLENSRQLQAIAADFTNEVLDQQVRLDLEERYGHLRDAILKQAFAPLESRLVKKKAPSAVATASCPFSSVDFATEKCSWSTKLASSSSSRQLTSSCLSPNAWMTPAMSPLICEASISSPEPTRQR